MFDKKDPEDIFSQTDNAPQGAVGSAPLSPQAPIPQSPAAVPLAVPEPVRIESTPPAPHLSSGGGGLKTIVILLLALGAVATAAYLTYVFMLKPPASMGDVSGQDAEIDSDGDSVPDDEEGKGGEDDEEVEVIPDEPEKTDDQASFIDSDGDGLTNAEEIEFGTAVSKSDTDSDGLGDREEIKVYGTDPRRTDTDDDGFLDGQEVEGGYNPNGDGRLLEIPEKDEVDEVDES